MTTDIIRLLEFVSVKVLTPKTPVTRSMVYTHGTEILQHKLANISAKFMTISLKKTLNFTHLKRIETSKISSNTLNSCPIELKFAH